MRLKTLEVCPLNLTCAVLVVFAFCCIFTPRQIWTLAWSPEIQTVSIVADEASREVFNISTGSSKEIRPEIQVVTVTYDDIDEVQKITTSQVFKMRNSAGFHLCCHCDQ